MKDSLESIGPLTGKGITVYSNSLKRTSKDSPIYPVICSNLYFVLSPSHKETLQCLVDKGPLWDGDVPSKSARDDLIELGLALRIVNKGEQGHTAASYTGWDVYKAKDVASVLKEDLGEACRSVNLRDPPV